MAGSNKHQNAYAILGLNKGAAYDEIKRAYYDLVKQPRYNPELHPDRFMVLNKAFETLSDPVKRAQEDVVTFNYIQGEYFFTDDEKTELPDAQLDAAIEQLLKKKQDGSMPAAEADRKLIQAYMMRSFKKVNKKLWAEAIADWQSVLALEPGNRRAKNNLMHSLVSLGLSYATHHLYDEAVDVWTQAIEMNPDNLALVHNLALAHEFAGNMREASRYWTETIRRWKAQLQREPDNEYLKNCLIEALRSHGEGALESEEPAGDGSGAKPATRAARSIEDFREIVRLNPDDFEAHYQIASLLMKDQKWGEAIETLNEMRRKWPRSVEVLNLLGWAMLNGGQVDDAFTIWRKARTIEPKNHQITESLIKAHMSMGRTMREKGLFTPCLVHFKALLRYLPDDSDVLFEIAETYRMKGDERSAAAEYQKVLKLDPKHRGARVGLSQLKLRR